MYRIWGGIINEARRKNRVLYKEGIRWRATKSDGHTTEHLNKTAAAALENFATARREALTNRNDARIIHLAEVDKQKPINAQENRVAISEAHQGRQSWRICARESDDEVKDEVVFRLQGVLKKHNLVPKNLARRVAHIGFRSDLINYQLPPGEGPGALAVIYTQKTLDTARNTARKTLAVATAWLRLGLFWACFGPAARGDFGDFSRPGMPFSRAFLHF
ncbi:hypothetical protein DFH06DRAFT_1143100 [Mycena polygramma]|nr:hypothetical protein DFH06DRAFT_1143100 [Mycena polygramma]